MASADTLPTAVVVLVVLCVGLAARAAWQVLFNLTWHPLAAFPGPLLARSALWYEFYHDVVKRKGGQYMFDIERMHDQYGPIVRINPDELHVRDTAWMDTLYALGQRRDKQLRMVKMFGAPLSTFGTQMHDLHRLRRAALSPSFSKQSILRSESIIVEKVDLLCQGLGVYAHSGNEVVLRNALIAVTIDIITEYCFGRPVGALDSPDFTPIWEEVMSGATEAAPMAKHFPDVISTLRMVPVSVLSLVSQALAMFTTFEGTIRQQVQNTIDQMQEQTPSIFTRLLESDLPEQEKGVERLTQEGVSLVAGGSETTSMMIASTIYHVLANEDVLLRLQTELDGAMPDARSLASWSQLEALPFLTAVIREGLRISTPIPARLPLISHQPLEYGNWTIPPGTVVSMSMRDPLRDVKVFPEPDKFDPTRWIEAAVGAEQMKAASRSFTAFGRGPRSCVGISLAYAELYLVLAAVFRRFDMRLLETQRQRDVDVARDHFVGKASRESRGVRVSIRGLRQ